MFYKIKQDNLYVILVDVNNELKRESELLFDNLWLDINEAVILFLETAVKNKDIPFPYKLNDNKLLKVSDTFENSRQSSEG
ncbi:MAG: hypothetical protein K2O68_01815, partial [Mucispirillum sp.]|nr:hypothetical protein [Mucispirillum sp.]